MNTKSKQSPTGVVIPRQDAIEVFINEAGGITIKQGDFGGEDSIVCVAPENAVKLANAIKAAAAKSKELD